jgi:hypothetical protein
LAVRPLFSLAAAVGILAAFGLGYFAVNGFGDRADDVAAEAAAGPPQLGDFTTSFQTGRLKPGRLDSHIDYRLGPRTEHLYVHVPASYSASAQDRYGLVVYLDPGDKIDGEPDGWQEVLDRRKLLFVAPLRAGNHWNVSLRLGIGVLSALEMERHYRIDPARIYVAGLSGGARMAGLLGFYQPDLFRGTIQSCGADFYQRVPQVVATSQVDTAGEPYGVFDATADEIQRARQVRFALVTGSKDFRRGNIVDIYNGGFAATGYQAKLFDVPGKSHENADAATLAAALDFIEAPK